LCRSLFCSRFRVSRTIHNDRQFRRRYVDAQGDRCEHRSRILLGFTPGGIEDFFRESGQPATDDGPAPPIDKDEIARMTAAAPKYGIEIVAVDD
jgi:hypothetical protein